MSFVNRLLLAFVGFPLVIAFVLALIEYANK